MAPKLMIALSTICMLSVSAHAYNLTTKSAGCNCDCSWTHGGTTCGKNDGSFCWACCCGGNVPTPPPAPTPPSPSGAGTLYCPSIGDWSTRYGSVSWNSATRGWSINGNGGVQGKASFNLLGGYVEFDIDTSRVNAAINANFYTTSPTSCCSYCDIQDNGSPTCMEMDIIEANGNCAMATTWHTWANKNGGCDQNGCVGTSRIGGQTKVRASFSQSGFMTVSLNGNAVQVNNPSPSGAAQASVASTMKSIGAMFQSSQWSGWVPEASSCPSGGDLGSSVLTVANIKIMGTVVQGEEPSKC